MNISVIGLDIAKQVFHLIALDNRGKQEVIILTGIILQTDKISSHT